MRQHTVLHHPVALHPSELTNEARAESSLFELCLARRKKTIVNPIKAGITHYAEEYPWSSWHEYIGNKQPYICNTYVPIKRLQQSGLTLHDLIEMVNELTPNREQYLSSLKDCRGAKEEDNCQPLPDDCGCLEMDETEIYRQLTDEDVHHLLLEISHCETIAQFQRLPIEQIVAHILQASHQGAAMKKLSRITGNSYRQINKIVKRNSNNS